MKKTATKCLELAGKHMDVGFRKSGRAALDDAVACFAAESWEPAARFALRSLRLTVGEGHVDYHMAASLIFSAWGEDLSK